MSMILPVVLSGGAGRRLWPLSTERQPKQFLRIWPSGRSLFQDAVLRLAGGEFGRPVVVCNASQETLVRQHADGAGVPLGALLLEPLRRDSAAAVAVATAWANVTHGPDAIVVVLPSDHLIRDVDSFRHACRRAAAIATGGHIVTFGIRPVRAATEFGYVESGAPLHGYDDAFAVHRFHEKPDADTAARYLASGAFDWNGGILAFMVKVFREEAERYMADIWLAAAQAVLRGVPAADALALDETAFASARRISIDHALLEKSGRLALLRAGFDWSDLGNWAAVREALGTDLDGNVRYGDVEAKDCRDCLIMSESGPVRVLGLEGVAVVVSDEGVLALKLDEATRIKDVLA